MKKLTALLLLSATTLFAQQQPNDADYTAQIRKFTTGPQFMTELVDHLPASDSVPTPLKFNGYIAGADGHLTYAEDVARYLRALEGASKRIKVLPIGKSEEGREMIVAILSSEDTIANLDRYRDVTRRLADPRAISDADAAKLIESGKPIYYLTGTIHSPETGSPEMLMELAYRLVVDESPEIRGIRDNTIVMMTPVVEVDGRDRQVDLWRYREANPNVPTPPLVYWGHYVAHDNNRDNLGLSLALSRNILQTVMQFHPTVLHDLHESVPFMYVMSGTGPFNPALDPIMIDEWHRMAYHDVDEMTRRGLPGVWLHGFYDGWAPNYMFWAGTGHNAIARFYETFGNRWPMTADRVVRGASDRQWYRPNPPLPQVKWSFRDNINYQQSGVLFSLIDMSKNRQHFLENFYTLGKRAVAKATGEGPAAWVFDGAQKRQNNLRDLMTLLVQHGVEINVADAPFTVKPGWPPAPPKKEDAAAEKKPAADTVTFAKGTYIVRMDQPYSRLADAILDVQYVRGEEKVYDDTGWTLGYLKNVDFKRVVNQDVLKVQMHRWNPEKNADAPRVITNNAETEFARAVFAAKNPRISEEETTVDGRKVPAGSLIADSSISVKAHEWKAPRIALLHTWQRTQDEGWYRIALDSLGIPYTYISTQQVAAIPNLRERFDVILFPPTGGISPQDIVNGMPPGPPLPWKKTALTPNLGGIDETEDMRPGLGLTGVERLANFVDNGGLLITAEDTSEFAVEYGLARWVTTTEPRALKSPGTIILASVADKKSPIAAGYDDTLPVYFGGEPVFQVGTRERPGDSRPSGRGGKDDPDVVQGHAYVPLPERAKPAPGEEGFQKPEDAPWNTEHLMVRPEDRPRVVVAFAKPADKLLMSGMLEGGDEIAGKPAVIDAPRGRGHVLLFANNPMWRGNTQGTYALVTNAIVNWDRLR